jgi:nicotinate-nucleotide adenylyltransferase
MRIGIFGGTFDPPHLGHLAVAQEVHHRLALDTVLWIPAALPPHKQTRQLTPGPVRLAMVRAAIAGDPRFSASDLELTRDGPSFTVHTLRQLSALHPGARLFLVLGADQAAELHTWLEPDEIRRLATLVAFARDGEEPPSLDGGTVVRVPRLDISSTEIRRRVAASEPIRYLVPAGVEAVLGVEGLYAAPAGR